MSTYIWSDLHLNHSNIIEYENRPFSSVQEMNDVLLGNWRKAITKHDTIINLGDVFLKMSKEEIGKIIKNLPGNKMLILGNHDRGHSISWWREVGFDQVYKYPIIYNDFYILSHEPVYVNQSMPYVNIHGHTHSESSDNYQKVNVSVDVINYTPVDIKTILKKFERGLCEK